MSKVASVVMSWYAIYRNLSSIEYSTKQDSKEECEQHTKQGGTWTCHPILAKLILETKCKLKLQC